MRETVKGGSEALPGQTSFAAGYRPEWMPADCQWPVTSIRPGAARRPCPASRPLATRSSRSSRHKLLIL
ncbi:hypothetical protein CHELA40_14124 [Chelatococcus asaccharovorans]|nr:hypothetical protein CHELA17_61497 [Chelatococcus asaccharovorans]CAH1675334.1 hypothetical protein CHELA40_14124 [Chelatococcus asaccharovorans]